MARPAVVSREAKLLPPQTTFVRLKLEDEEGAPLARCPFRISAGARSTEGATDAHGVLEAEAPLAEEAELRVQAPGGERVYQLRFAALDPAASVRGAQQRLRTLGHECEVTGEADARTREALQRFQLGAGLPATGELDETTAERLERAYRGA